jgi:RES domain-containing protein
LILWRISNYPDLSGAGGLMHPGRWHTRGRPIIYLAESAAGALLEALVHVEATHPGELPRNYQLLEIDVPDATSADNALKLDCPTLPEGWQKNLTITRRYGDEWLASGASLLLHVPSAVVGRTFNYLFNPLHRSAATWRIVSVARYPFDDRLLGS